MNSPVVTPALYKNAVRTSSGRPRIGILGMIFVNVIDNVTNYLAMSRAYVAIDTGVCPVALVGEQTVITPLMIVHDIVANNRANAIMRILDSSCSGATIRCSTAPSILNRIVLDGDIQGPAQTNGLVSIMGKGVIAYQ